jgi:hypothetical protein
LAQAVEPAWNNRQAVTIDPTQPRTFINASHAQAAFSYVLPKI